MRLHVLNPATLAFAALAACAPAATTSVPAPTPVPAADTVRGVPTTPTAPTERPARNWQLLDLATDGVLGTSVERAYRELLAGKTPRRTVVVAVIDGGVDTAHADLHPVLWSNPKEVAGNRADDDGNGYPDDMRGWDFIGGPGGDVHQDTYELTRLVARCTKRPAARGDTLLTAAERAQCPTLAAELEQKRREAEQQLPQVRFIAASLAQVMPVLRSALGDSVTPERVRAFQPRSAQEQSAKAFYLQLANNGITPKDIEEGLEQLETQLEYGYNLDFDPRGIVGDDYRNTAERRYGNADVTGPDADHGTHVAGIIAAARGNGTGIDGIAPTPAVRIMAVRTVPDGDERDKDVANAIRYAVDNGAQVINMSFGKAYSPQKGAVDAAVKYADGKGVLMVHAAGNEGENTADHPSFPTPVYLDGGRAQHWIEVGASSWKSADSLAADFSNWGPQVDLFAPGVDILSSVQGGGYQRLGGTSMASPVVAGVAALLMAYYPELTAADVKRILLASSTKRGDLSVLRPGGGEAHVPFSALSSTGGVVNAFEAVRMAEDLVRSRR
ncbi:MAG: S8 family peptidase [Gemmatimonadaceae bacterium]